MDAVKKTRIEQGMVIGLAALFGISFVTGPMKSLGWFNRAAQATAQVQEKVNVSKPIGAIFREQWKLPMQEEPASPKPVLTERELMPAYGANDLRDPLKSFLPEKPLAPASGSQNVVSEELIQPPPPPALRIRGIVWGGGDGPKALINDQVYEIGSEVDGVKILSIDHHGVMVDYLGTPMLYPADSNLQRPAGGGISQ